MAEVMEKTHEEIPSNAKVNAALTTGIIGTSLSGLLALGALGKGAGLLGGSNCSQTASTCGTPVVATNGCCTGAWGYPGFWGVNVPHGDLYLERKQCQDYIDLTKEYYEGQIATNKQIDKNFFDLYKMNVDTSFGLYKNHVDDSFRLWKSQIDADFSLYKGQRDDKDQLLCKINEVDKKVDMMAAVRPYQDALINAKIDNVALVSDFNLARRTCRMIEGEVVLPNTPTVTGYPSYCCCSLNTAAATATTA